MSNIMQICRVCLKLDVKVTFIQDERLVSFISNILKQNNLKSLHANHCICLSCKALLCKSFNFIQKIIRAQKELRNVSRNNVKITRSLLQKIDRKKLGLDLELHYKHNSVDFSFREGVSFSNSDEDNIPLQFFKKGQRKIDNEYTKQDIKNYDVKPRPYRPINDTLSPELSIQFAVDETDQVPLESKFDVNETKSDGSYVNYTTPLSSMILTGNSSAEIDAKEENEFKETNKEKCILVFGDNLSDNIDPTDPLNEVASDGFSESISAPLSTVPNDLDLKDVNVLTDNQVKSLSRRRVLKQYSIKYITESSDSDNDKTKKMKRNSSSEYSADSTESSSSSESEHSYNERGLRVKKKRVYPVQCDHCDYVANNGMEHFQHYVIIHPDKKYPYSVEKTYLCPICGYTCGKTSQYEAHYLTHGEKNQQCPKCEKKFTSLVKVKRHMNVVHREKKLICDYCQKGFKTRCDMVQHLRMHTGDKPFKCHICGVGYAHRANVKWHIRTKHQEENNCKKKKRRCTNKKLKKNQKTKTIKKSKRHVSCVNNG